MTKPASKKRSVDLLAERSFYLDEFRTKTLFFSCQLEEDAADLGLDDVARALGELLAADARALLLVGHSDARRGRASTAAARLRRLLGQRLLRQGTAQLFPKRAGKPSLAGLIGPIDRKDGEQQLIDLWAALRSSPLFVGLVPPNQLLATSEWIASRLRPQKWVVLEPDGGIASKRGNPISFIDDSVLTELLRTGAAEWSGTEGRRATLQAVQGALRAGVEAVNLCAPDQVGVELFTYEGSGTLFTLEDYCRVAPLGVDDFAEVEGLLRRGQQEGFLKSRDSDEIGEILLNGFGATVGHHHLAGVCGLLTAGYERSRAGEVAGLYTFTRFKGEGIGGRLLQHLFAEGSRRGLRYLFACTTNDNAAQFFQRNGFSAVARSAVPAAKWRGYDRARLKSVRVLRHDL